MELPNNKQEIKLDHRELNKTLEIYFSDEKIGQGLPILLEKGVIIKNLIQNFIRSKEQEQGCKEVISPVLSNPALFQESGHFSHYSDYMFPTIEKESEKFQLRPMTCPHHCIIYKRKTRSYRDLPIWFCEHSILHRFESSGSLKGLERVRWMEISDNHIFTSEEYLNDAFKKCFIFVSEVFKKFNINVERLVCSLHDSNSDKYHDNEQLWEKSESILINSLNELKVDFVKIKGEAAFYGPKLDFEVKAIDGKNITLATIQFDFILPKKFDLNYINEKGEQVTPIIVHFSAIGSYQRFISILLEQTQGKLPFWLSPLQIVLIPFFNNENEKKIIKYCDDLKSKLNSIVRIEVWKEKRLNYRIRKIHQLKIPSYIVIGEKEVNSNLLTYVCEYGNSKIELSKLDLIKKLI
jgi:threonyl-tRNA synthetase